MVSTTVLSRIENSNSFLAAVWWFEMGRKVKELMEFAYFQRLDYVTLKGCVSGLDESWQNCSLDSCYITASWWKIYCSNLQSPLLLN